MLQKMRNAQGFTLIELMIVIAIIGILAAIAIPNFIAYRDKSYCSKVESDVHSISVKATGYLVDNTTLADYEPNWSNGVVADSNVSDAAGIEGLSLSDSGVLTVAGTDDSGRCPRTASYSIVGGQSSGAWY